MPFFVPGKPGVFATEAEAIAAARGRSVPPKPKPKKPVVVSKPAEPPNLEFRGDQAKPREKKEG